MNRMVVSERSISHETLIETFAGRFDQHARQDFKWRIDHAISQGYRFVVLNMVAVSFVDSAALGWLVLAQRRFYRIGGKMCIIAPAGFVRDILELTEIGEWIPIFGSEAEAVQALNLLSPSSTSSSS
ncbi:MAG: STAS domain-containing protein [Nitrospira sp.]|nr:STAS domain-containing protein [Nitrospira sp.]